MLTPRATAPLAALVLLAALHAAPSSAATLTAPTTAILTGTPSLQAALPAPVGPSYATGEAISDDGKRVVFSSSSDGLLAGDDDTIENVYVKDLASRQVTLLSRETGVAGAVSHEDCYDPAISGDGKVVAFTCESDLDPSDTNGKADVYVRVLATGVTELVSRSMLTGAAASNGATDPTINKDGRYIAFTSTSRLASFGEEGLRMAYRRDRSQQETVAVSRDPVGGASLAFAANEPSISDDGMRVAVVTYAGLASNVDVNGQQDVYVRDLAANTTTWASRAPGNGPAGNGESYAPAIAGNGSSVAFESRASNFAEEDSDATPDVYWRSLTAGGNTALVNMDFATAQRYAHATAPAIDATGNRVAFVLHRTGPDAADASDVADAYVRDLTSGTLTLVSRATGETGAALNDEAEAVALTGDGTAAAVSLGRGRGVPGADPRQPTVVTRGSDGPFVTTHVTRPFETLEPGLAPAPFANEGGTTKELTLSADGRFAAFTSDAPGLGLPADAAMGVFVRDRVTGDVTLVSRRPDGAPFTGELVAPLISADGRVVAFTAQGQAWVRDLAAGTTTLASRGDGPAGAEGNAASRATSIDDDGSRVAFMTSATNLGDGDADAIIDVHVRDLAAGRTLLASRADGAEGAKGNQSSTFGQLNGAGTRVAFLSAAANLGDGDADARQDVHLRDLEAGTTRLVDTTPAGKADADASSSISIDAGGDRIAFASTATNLGAPGTDRKVFVRDMESGAITPVETGASDPVLSSDGRYVAFRASGRVHLRDLATGATELISRNGDAVASFAGVHDVTAGGGCVAFGTNDGLIGDRSDYQQVYLRVLADDCAPRNAPPAGANGGAGGPVAPTSDPRSARDTTAPVLSRVRLQRKRFRGGTTLRFRSSEAATLTVTIERRRAGRRASFKRRGTITRRIKKGNGRLAITGKVRGRRLAPGKYRLVLRARDAAGNQSKRIARPFALLPR